MRVRVRAGAQTVRVEVPGSSCSWAELRRAIAAQLGLPSDQEDELQLSLNKRDALAGDEEADVKSLGIAGGDLLWVLHPGFSDPPPPGPEPKRAKEAAAEVDPKPAAMDSADTGNVPGPQADAPGAAALMEEEGGAEQFAGAFSTPTDDLPAANSLPSYLLRTLAHNAAATPAHVLLLAAHAGMLEAGFEPAWVAAGSQVAGAPAAAPSNEQALKPGSSSVVASEGGSTGRSGASPSVSPYALPASTRASASLFRLPYRLPALQRQEQQAGDAGGGQGAAGEQAAAAVPGEAGVTCTLQCSTLGPSALVLVASTPKGHAHSLSLCAASFLRESPAEPQQQAQQAQQEHQQEHGAAAGPSSAAPGQGGVAPTAAGGAPGDALCTWDGQALRTLGGRWELPVAAARQLWRALKDSLAFPMLLAAYADAGLPPPAGLLALPEELKLGILEQLNALQLAALSATCAEMRHLASQDDLWRPLFETEFPAAPAVYASQAQRRGYKWAFGACWRDRQQREEAARRQRRFMPAIPNMGPRPPFYPPPGRFGVPGITGGDYDRLPQPFLGGGPGMYPGGGGGLGGLMFGGSRRRGGQGGGGHHFF